LLFGLHPLTSQQLEEITFYSSPLQNFQFSENFTIAMIEVLLISPVISKLAIAMLPVKS